MKEEIAPTISDDYIEVSEATKRARKISLTLVIASVYKNLNKSVSKLIIFDVASIMLEYIKDNLFEGNAVSIDNFGTFSYIDKDKVIKTGLGVKGNRFSRIVRFYLSDYLKKVIKRKRKMNVTNETIVMQ